MDTANTHHYDAIIIGGGLAGLTLSCLLGKAGIKTACIDQAPPLKQQNLDLRTTAISYGSSKILERAGIWSRMQGKTSAISHIEIFDGHSPLLLNFMKNEVDDKDFGWIVENTDLKQTMMDLIEGYACVTYMPSTTLTTFNTHHDHVECIITQDNQPLTLTTKLVIGADGRNSLTRKLMGVRTRQWRYNQRAVICTVAHENPHNNIAVEHFWPQGPFAVLPMADDVKTGQHRSSVVFTEHGHESKSLMRLSDEEFEIALATRFPERYGDVALIGRRACYPLSLVHAADYITPRMALVADAAHGIHPIAGQGLNLGFRDIDEISRLITAAHETGNDIGNYNMLETYQRHRRPDNMAMVAMTDGLNRLFSNNIPPVRLARKAGLKIISKLKPAKRFFMKQAMGDR